MTWEPGIDVFRLINAALSLVGLILLACLWRRDHTRWPLDLRALMAGVGAGLAWGLEIAVEVYLLGFPRGPRTYFQTFAAVWTVTGLWIMWRGEGRYLSRWDA